MTRRASPSGACRRRRAGLTLIELVVSMVVISVAVTGTLLALNATVVRSADPLILHQAAAIAESYLEEILSRAYLDPDDGTVCPAPEASRDLYDNICDYAGLSDIGARNQQDQPVTGLDAYQVQVGVDTAASLNGLVGSAQVLRVDVTVIRPGRVNLTLSGYRGAP